METFPVHLEIFAAVYNNAQFVGVTLIGTYLMGKWQDFVKFLTSLLVVSGWLQGNMDFWRNIKWVYREMTKYKCWCSEIQKITDLYMKLNENASYTFDNTFCRSGKSGVRYKTQLASHESYAVVLINNHDTTIKTIETKCIN